VTIGRAVPEPLVSLEGVGKSYGTGAGRQRVLDGLSLEMDAGEFVVVLGPSGCGKTTLLNLIGGLDTADSGRVHACGVELTGASRAELTAYRASSVGFVFQFYNLLPTLTAQENVEAGVRVAGVDRVAARESAR
jgi:putative ABC transport system ATP-binding protein